MRVIIDRDKAADLGVTVASIAEAINVLISGKVDITKYKDEAKGRLYDVRVRMNPQDRMSPGDIGQIYVRAKDGRLVELANVVKIQEGGAPSTITLRERGMLRREAILETGSVRLQPILMTTFTMVFGMLPVAAGLGEGAETRSPMGVVLIGGLITSLFLTLIVVTAAYDLLVIGLQFMAKQTVTRRQKDISRLIRERRQKWKDADKKMKNRKGIKKK